MFGIKNIIFIVVFLAAAGFFIYSTRRLISFMLLGTKEDRFDDPVRRIKNVLIIAFGQTKLLRDKVAGTLHFLIFWGFMLFITAVLEAVIQGFYSPFTWEILGPLYAVVTVVQDIFGVLVIGSVLYSLYRRFIEKVPRLKSERHGQLDAAFILTMIMLVVISMFGQNMAHVAKNGFVFTEYEIRPVSTFLAARLFDPFSQASYNIYEICWWVHILVVLSFVNFLPYSKHLHVLSSIPNVYFSKFDEKKGALKPINLEDESLESYGADDIEKLSWKQLLDGYSCTECGRCTSVCPAANTGKSLSPRKIIVDIRRRTEDKGPLVTGGVKESVIYERTLVHDYISDTELWQCTTCMACVQECPVMIEHVDSIVDMRRHLVLTESNFPAELNNVFKSLETNGSPWAFNPADRAEWAEGMNIKTMAEDPNGEVLFWVGCAGSFDNRYKKVTKAFAGLMQKGNIDFRILGTEEKCNGDTARRLGNEYLAQTMMQENIGVLNGYGVKKIVTACPHCFNSLKTEFPQFGGNFEVQHHSELIHELIESGKIEMKEAEEPLNVTYHDSCYIGRYNDIYEEPREVLEAAPSVELTEMERNRTKGFCCGAGGGRMFLEDVEGGRINEERTKEALETGATTIGTACPFCMTMMTDGVKAHDKADTVQVKDIAELVLENTK